MTATKETSALEYLIGQVIPQLVPDANRQGLAETPARVTKYLQEITSGYDKDPAQILKVFTDGADNVDEMIVVGGIPFYSMCEHHMAPFFGVAHVAYIPGKRDPQGISGDDSKTRIVGLSKIPRLLEIFARRLQVQERITDQVADTLYKELGALGVGVVIRARHLCMESRGVQARGTVTYTSSLRGAIKDKPEARNEFMQFVALADARMGSL
ncbi:MAG TPA: GTP cyclohydrolase I FolE [Rhizorhapis sp.]|nr:GTP cyclohydrolase I FolE [Rhizorhapis sp.]